jgi:GNAT superfamily N-acetyltransferase
MPSPAAQVVGYDERLLPAYVALNRQWIEHHFRIEEMDLRQLNEAKSLILDAGGEIFFVVENGEAVGTCAMVPHGPGCYELAKMAVAPSARGKGYGDALMERCVDWAREKGAKRILILSNTVLTPAITLYRKHGFRQTGTGSPDYQRCNIEMERDL